MCYGIFSLFFWYYSVDLIDQYSVHGIVLSSDMYNKLFSSGTKRHRLRRCQYSSYRVKSRQENIWPAEFTPTVFTVVLTGRSSSNGSGCSETIIKAWKKSKYNCCSRDLAASGRKKRGGESSNCAYPFNETEPNSFLPHFNLPLA